MLKLAVLMIAGPVLVAAVVAYFVAFNLSGGAAAALLN